VNFLNDLAQRKNIRLKDYDYSSNVAYFITICVKNKHELLGKINVGRDAHIVPSTIKLSAYGIISKRYIENICTAYNDVIVEKYAIMPNLIIFLIMERWEASLPIKHQ
jgi:putative transposase